MSGRVRPRKLQIVTPEEELENLRNEVGVLRRAVESKTAAVGILRGELQECQRERDKFRTLAEQGPLHRPTPPPLPKPASCPEPSRSAMVSGSEDTLAQLLSRSKEENRTLRQDVAQLRCRLHDAQADTKVLREEVERWRGGRGRGNGGHGSLVTPPVLSQQQKEQFISQMEQLSVKCQALEGDVRGLVEEREELVRELDAASHKLHRLNYILTTVLSSSTPALSSPTHHPRRTVDLDAIITENRYLQQRVKQAEEEAGLARSNATKYKAALEKCRSQGSLKLGASETLIVTPKQVSELLLEYRGEVGGAAEGDLKNLCVALVDSLNQRSRALRTQRSANKVLVGRVSELERRLSTGGGSEASGTPPSSPGARGQGGDRAGVGLQLASTRLMDGYTPSADPTRFKGDGIFNDPRLEIFMCRRKSGNVEGSEGVRSAGEGSAVVVNAGEGSAGQGGKYNVRVEEVKVIVVKSSGKISDEEKCTIVKSKERNNGICVKNKASDASGVRDQKENGNDGRKADPGQMLNHEENMGSAATDNEVQAREENNHKHLRNTRSSGEASKQHKSSQDLESTKTCETVLHCTQIVEDTSHSSNIHKDVLHSYNAALENMKTQKDISKTFKDVSGAPENQRVTDTTASISMQKSASVTSSKSANGEERLSVSHVDRAVKQKVETVIQGDLSSVPRDMSKQRESSGKRRDESSTQEPNSALREASTPSDSKHSARNVSTPRESQTTLNPNDELEEIIPIDQLDSYIREVKREAGRAGKKAAEVEERLGKVEERAGEVEEQVEELIETDEGVKEIVGEVENKIEERSEEKVGEIYEREGEVQGRVEEVSKVTERIREKIEGMEHQRTNSDCNDDSKKDSCNTESNDKKNSMNSPNNDGTPHKEGEINGRKSPYEAVYKGDLYCNDDLGNYLSEDEDTSFNLDLSDYDSDDDKLDAALQAWQSDVGGGKRGRRSGDGSSSGGGKDGFNLWKKKKKKGKDSKDEFRLWKDDEKEQKDGKAKRENAGKDGFSLWKKDRGDDDEEFPPAVKELLDRATETSLSAGADCT